MKKILALILVSILLLTSCDLDFSGVSTDNLSNDSIIVDNTTLSPEDPDSSNNNDEQNKPDDNKPDDNKPDNNTPDDNTGDNKPDDNTGGNTDETHNYTATVTAPTCDSAGYTTYTCSDCGDTYVANEVAPNGHSYNSTVSAPSCESNGYTKYTCTVCFYSYTANTTPATGHSWKDATTEAPKTCTTCGKTEGDKLPAIDTLYVHYIDVGQGDSIFIKVGDCDILIDAGTADYGATVSNYLKSKGVDDIELMINTHADADHCGGLTRVLNDYIVEEVWISKDTNKNTNAYNNFISAISREGLAAKKPDAGTVYVYEYMTITVLYNAKGSDTNNSSIVCMLEYGSHKFLFTGDIGEEVETKLVNSKVDLKCDVLKVGHHGSKYSSTTAFLKAVDAKYGVICVGANNRYDHPTSEALNRLSAARITVFRTDLKGHIVFSTNGTTLTVPQ